VIASRVFPHILASDDQRPCGSGQLARLNSTRDVERSCKSVGQIHRSIRFAHDDFVVYLRFVGNDKIA
jgi:hypothetical protein